MRIGICLNYVANLLVISSLRFILHTVFSNLSLSFYIIIIIINIISIIISSSSIIIIIVIIVILLLLLLLILSLELHHVKRG